MDSIVTYRFADNFIDRLVDDIEENYGQEPGKLENLAIVFGGKRPALFLKRELARRLKKNFYPPKIFTIDEFVTYLIGQQEMFRYPSDLDNQYLLYRLAQRVAGEILKGREPFYAFLPWAQEILSFIEQLDLENVSEEALSHIQSHARIGYEVPEDINRLLASIVNLRKAYHKEMIDQKIYPRGLRYLRAAQLIPQISFSEFDQILFCNFFYFHRCEEMIIKNLYERKKARLIFQGDDRQWPILERISKSFSCSLREETQLKSPVFQLKLYAGFDVQSQMGLVREILKQIKNPQNTVIVLPRPEHISVLLSEITSVVKDYNVSMGYPLKRSSLYALLQLVLQTQLSSKNSRYYTKDYLKVLRHPFVKNLTIHGDPRVMRILIHKIEEILTGQEKTSLSGTLFLDLKDLEQSEDLFLLASQSLKSLDLSVSRRELAEILKQIHKYFFEDFKAIRHFDDFAQGLEQFLDLLLEKSFLKNYPLNLNIALRMHRIIEELRQVSFAQEEFSCEEIFRVFDAKISREMVAFSGSPLKELQILGLFETRSLNFENVIIVDVNEGILPKLKVYDPLIPREVMISLNLDRLELEEEIQRYQLMRLISSAKHVHLVYQESKDKERSRFVEELIWEREKEAQGLGAIDVQQASFEIKVAPTQRSVAKTPEMIAQLKKHTYSASSINTYIRNPLEFYYRYVLGLKESEDLLDEPEARQIGTFVHEFLEEAFQPCLKKKFEISEAFQKRFLNIFDERFDATFGKGMKSDAFLLKAVMEKRLNHFLEKEAWRASQEVAKILYLEQRFEDVIPLSIGDINCQYIVDRVDQLKDKTVMIIDYKTGSLDQMPKSINRIKSMPLSRESIKEHVKSFQIPLYFYYLDKQFKDQPINAAIYHLKTMEMQKFIDDKMSFDRTEINQTFLRCLNFIITEIWNPEIPFEEDTDR